MQPLQPDDAHRRPRPGTAPALARAVSPDHDTILLVEIHGSRITLRPWRRGDAPALVKYANDRDIWRNLRDLFPHPYTADNAREWISLNERREPPYLNFAIILDEQAIGGVGLERQRDVQCYTAEVGYWVGRPFWRRGIATEAVRLIVDHAFGELDFQRLEAGVFEWNPASCRVLEKAGFSLEGRLRRNVLKDGSFLDTLVYGRLRQD